MRQDIEEIADLLVVENNSDSVMSVEMHKRVSTRSFFNLTKEISVYLELWNIKVW